MSVSNSLTIPVEFKYFKAESLTEDQLAAAYRQHIKTKIPEDRAETQALFWFTEMEKDCIEG